MADEIKLAVRQLLKSPGFAAVAIFTLALGIGANVIVFSVAKTVLYRSLGLQTPERLAWIRWVLPQENGREDLVSWRDLEDIRAGTQSFEAIAMVSATSVVWRENDRVEEHAALFVTPDLVGILQVQPVLGRMLLPSDAVESAGRVALISYEVWQSRFAGDPAAIGKSVRLDDVTRTIIGVLPSNLNFPMERERGSRTGSSLKGGGQDFWAPLRVTGEDRTSRGARMFQVIGRLRQGVSMISAQAELSTVSRRLALDHPESNGQGRFELIGLREKILGRTQQGIPILSLAVAAVLIICCVNLANLLLARAATRQREVAVRVALGARRWCIIRSTLLECLLLALVGGGLAVGVAYLALHGIRILGASSVPFILEVSLDWAVMSFALLLSVLTALMFGWLPALRQARIDPADALRAGVRSTGNRDVRSWQRALLISQVAVVVVLLAAAGLLLESFRRLLGQELGYRPQSVVTMDLSAHNFDTNGDVCRMYRKLRDRLAALPGVRAVGTISSVPLTGKWTFSEKPRIIGEGESVPEAARPSVEATFVAFDYFQAMGIPLIDGRFFHDSEMNDNGYGRIVMLNESAAARLFPRRSAVGGRFTVGSNPDRVLEVIGVVKDTRDVRLEEAPQPRFYWQYPFGGAQVVVRSDMPARVLIPMLREAVRETDKRVVIGAVKPMAEIIAGTVAERRFLMSLVTIYAVVALGMAAVGIFGVVGYQVAQRTNEFGVRLALGATRERLFRLVLGQAGRLVTTGMAIGIACSLGVNRLLASQLFGLSPHDPLLMAVTAMIILTVSLLASYYPARRAANVAPMEALKCE
jgi:predicted permease